MGRFATTLLVGLIAYKLGEQYAQVNANDYFLNRQYLDGSGNLVVDYVVILPSGEMDYVLDRAQATPFSFWGAKNLRNTLKTYAPQIPISLEIVNPALLN